ncbi:MAG: hypothetical protein BJ554DRAFT_5638, partial [Olpidium bornovanus]
MPLHGGGREVRLRAGYNAGLRVEARRRFCRRCAQADGSSAADAYDVGTARASTTAPRNYNIPQMDLRHHPHPHPEPTPVDHPRQARTSPFLPASCGNLVVDVPRFTSSLGRLPVVVPVRPSRLTPRSWRKGESRLLQGSARGGPAGTAFPSERAPQWRRESAEMAPRERRDDAARCGGGAERCNGAKKGRRDGAAVGLEGPDLKKKERENRDSGGSCCKASKVSADLSHCRLCPYREGLEGTSDRGLEKTPKGNSARAASRLLPDPRSCRPPPWESQSQAVLWEKCAQA